MTQNLTTNFNITPYWDDYNEEKDFQRMLFRPAFAVQARELTQLQTILQKQIQRFGDHIFKNGTIVQGCDITYTPILKYVHVKNIFNTTTSNNAFDDSLKGFLLVANNGVRAVVRELKTGYEAQYPATNRLYVDYIRSGVDGSNNIVSEFDSAQQLFVYNTNQDRLGTLEANNLYNSINTISANHSGNSYAVTVGEGVIFQKGFFLRVEPQTLIVKEYDTNVNTYVVGFKTNEEIVTAVADVSLNDPAQDSKNYNAPGAHRLKLTPTLVAYAGNAIPTNIDFFPIIEFDKTDPVEQQKDPQYNILGEALAKRTFEESGDYVVKPFILEPIANEANTDILEYNVSSGVGYIQGNRIEFLNTRRTSIGRATTTANNNAEIITANYGKYVYVNEVVGVFDHENLQSVNIYDAPQDTITDVEIPSGAASGNIVGTANIRAFVYDSGTKNTSDCVYRFYLFNIKMNSGKSFTNDAKSFVGNGSYGYAKADIVLESSKAIIKDATASSLVFSTGVDGLKDLTDTEFVYRNIISGTLQTDGSATFTMTSGAAGGNDRVNYSSVSDSAENDFNIILSNTAFSSNGPGTLAISGVNVTGNGTSFTTTFANGEHVRTNGTVYRINTVSNSTFMTISTTAGVHSHNTYQRAFPAGSYLNLAGVNGTINIVSNTQFTVNTDITTVDSGTQTIYATYPVLRTDAVQIKKEARKNRFVKINPGSSKGPYNLGLVDVYKLRSVYVGSTYSNTNPDRIEWFTLDNGQNEEFYDHSKLVLKTQYKNYIDSSSRILVELDHFEANTAAGIGYFSVESYPVRPIGSASNSTNIEMAEIPVFKGNDLRNSIDFRPLKFNTANSATSNSTATENPSSSNNSFNVPAAGQHLPEPDSNFQSDIEYYLPRIDIVSISTTGEIIVKPGLPSLEPKIPVSDKDVMDIARVDVPPYPSLTPREAATYGRNDIKMSATLLSNRRYSMKDIGVLDERIRRLEYYTTLNALEQAAKDMTIRDANGLDRFKNGIFAEPFNSHKIGNVSDIEYDISIDVEKSIARPPFKDTPVDFRFIPGSSTAVRTGDVISLPYNSNLFISQNKASKTRNLTQSVWKWNGAMRLYPSMDHHKDTKELPDINVKIDLTEPWDEFAKSPFGKQYGEWRTKKTNDILSPPLTSKSKVGSKEIIITTKERTVNKLKVDTVKNTYDMGTYVKDISMSPYIRSREVAFVISGLKPNSRFWVYFDGKAVSTHVAPGSLATSEGANYVSGQAQNIVRRTGDFGATLTSDSTGNLYGIFRIPENTFRVGDRKFEVADVSNIDTDYDAILSRASAYYTASSISVSTQGSTLTTLEPDLRFTKSVHTQTNIKVVKNPIETPNNNIITNRPTWPEGDGEDKFGGNGYGGPDTSTNPSECTDDPLAQSFLITIPDSSTGMHLTSIGVYFKKKDTNHGVICSVVEMDGGNPDVTRTVAQSRKASADITVSNNATSETLFTFDNLPFLSANKYYAFILQPEGNSPEYLAYTAEIGSQDIVSGQQIFTNTNPGIMFVSANRNTWTAIQTEDIKFNVYRAEFTSAGAEVVFYNEKDEFVTTNGFTLANTGLSVKVGDEVYTQNSTGFVQTSNASPYGVVQSIDFATNSFVIDSSRGGFAAGQLLQIHRPTEKANTSAISNTSLIANTTVVSIDNVEYNAIVPQFAQIEPAYTSIDYTIKAMDGSYNTDGTYSIVEDGVEKEFFDKPRYVASYSNELLNGKSNSLEMKATLSTSSSFVSPIINLKKKTSTIIQNLINDDITNEETRYGEARTKYISKTIVLDEGQDAEDLKVFLTAYRPSTTDVHVYAKFLNAADGDNFEDKVWTKLTMSKGATTYSDPLNTNDFIEYEFNVPSIAPVSYAGYLDLNNSDILTYTDASGEVYVGFKKFAIKIVLTGETSARVPRLNDLRAIALQI